MVVKTSSFGYLLCNAIYLWPLQPWAFPVPVCMVWPCLCSVWSLLTSSTQFLGGVSGSDSHVQSRLWELNHLLSSTGGEQQHSLVSRLYAQPHQSNSSRQSSDPPAPAATGFLGHPHLLYSDGLDESVISRVLLCIVQESKAPPACLWQWSGFRMTPAEAAPGAWRLPRPTWWHLPGQGNYQETESKSRAGASSILV